MPAMPNPTHARCRVRPAAAAPAAGPPGCLRCGAPTDPAAAAVVYLGGAVECRDCDPRPAGAYPWGGALVEAAPAGFGGGLVLTVPAAGSRPARRYRLVLEEIPGGAP